jgi:hypothetical protein
MTMGVPCTWVRALRAARPGVGRGCVQGPDDVIREVEGGGPMSVPDLRRAATVLGRHVRTGRMDVAAARFRVASRLEQLGA